MSIPADPENQRKLVELLQQVVQDGQEEHQYSKREDDEVDILLAKQFNHLPRDTRRWLTTLSPDDIKGLQGAADLTIRLQKASRTAKILVLAIPIIATTLVGFLDNVQSLLHSITYWFKGHGS